MSDVTVILKAIEAGDRQAAAQLLPLVYEELRRLAEAKLAAERPGQTLSATALVHEAYLRLADAEQVRLWDSRGHFFAAAAEAMRRLLIDNARRKGAEKHGGGWHRLDVVDLELGVDSAGDDLLAVDEAMSRLAAQAPEIARMVELRFFAGLTLAQVADVLNISLRTANRHWTYARAWLRRDLDRENR